MHVKGKWWGWGSGRPWGIMGNKGSQLCLVRHVSLATPGTQVQQSNGANLGWPATVRGSAHGTGQYNKVWGRKTPNLGIYLGRPHGMGVGVSQLAPTKCNLEGMGKESMVRRPIKIHHNTEGLTRSNKRMVGNV